jgi:hypothetical protein
MRFETGSVDPGAWQHPASDGDPTDPALLAAALIAALEGTCWSPVACSARWNTPRVVPSEVYRPRGSTPQPLDCPPARRRCAAPITTIAVAVGLSPREAEVLALLAGAGIPIRSHGRSASARARCSVTSPIST